MSNKTYEQRMSEALAFTQEMGLDTSDITIGFSSVEFSIEGIAWMYGKSSMETEN